MARRPQFADDGSLDREPHLAAYFGVGLAATPEDLGTQGDPPSHPELLDWLAVELMDHDWSLKHIHRLIVDSATYRQSSDVTPQLLERDPSNRLLARGPRFRVDAEVVRDIALSASGLLNPEGRRAERVSASAGVPLQAAGELRPENLDRRHRARSVSTRHSTRSASDRSRIPRFQISMPRTAKWLVPAARGPIRRCKH